MSGPFGSSQWIYNSSTGFYPKTINGSLRFNRSDEGYLSFTPASDGNRKTWTYSTWVKRSRLNDSSTLLDASVSGGYYDILYFPSTNQLRYYNTHPQAGDRLTNEKFRDTAGWYHIVLAVDTTDSTAANRIKLYINGSQITSFLSTTNFDQNDDTRINAAVEHRIGQSIRGGVANLSFDGYMAETFFIDGTAHNADSFGETKNGIWVPKNVTSSDFTMGTNGWHLTFEDDSTVEAFNTTLWEGDGGTQAITGTGFSPDFVWIKNRDNADDHYLYDTVRGPKNFLNSNQTTVEDYSANDLISFDSDGFTVGSDGGLNRDGQSIAAWCWDAGANNTITGHSSVTYEGSGAVQKISGLPFRPDLVWAKARSGDTVGGHLLFDSVRGATKYLQSNSTGAEATDTTMLTSFDSDGFILGSSQYINDSGNEKYVAWCWDAGDDLSPVSNTDGSITSTVKASTTNGFSIISYTGTGANATVGHGLSSAPDWVLVKDRDNSNDWIVWHSGLADGTQHLKLNANEASSANTGYWNSTAPSSSVISLGSNSKTNGSSQKFIAYCWHDVTGKQKFGSYTGTGSSLDITLGFRAGWVMIKRTDSSDNWYIFDSSRDPFGMTRSLSSDAASSEGTSSGRTVTVDADSMTLGTSSAINASSGTYIYMAFAGSYSDFITDVNTDGSIESRVKASDTTGHSIINFEASASAYTVGHGLSAAPDWIIVKRRDGSSDWTSYHSALGETQKIVLNSTNAAGSTGAWQDTAPTSSVFTSGFTGAGDKYIAYCWTETTGVSKFGSYTGQPNITTGFKPAFILIKNITDNSTDWVLWDNTRNADNGNRISRPNLANTDASETIDISNTGFTAGTGSNVGASGKTYIYMAFADTREAAFWLDSSSNSNDWQHVHLDHNDTVNDSPTDNHAAFNPEVIMRNNASSYRGIGDFSEGNLLLTTNADNESGTIPFSASSGKYYMEFTSVNLAQRQQIIVFSDDNFRGDTGAVTTSSDGNGNATDRVTWTSGDVIGIAVDVDNSKVFIHKNGEYFGTSNPVTNSGGDTLSAFTGVGVRQDSGSTGTATISFNGGQQPFKHGPPE